MDLIYLLYLMECFKYAFNVLVVSVNLSENISRRLVLTEGTFVQVCVHTCTKGTFVQVCIHTCTNCTFIQVCIHTCTKVSVLQVCMHTCHHNRGTTRYVKGTTNLATHQPMYVKGTLNLPTAQPRYVKVR